MQQRRDDQHLLPHALRVGADRLLRGVGHAEQLEERAHLPLHRRRRQLAQPAEQPQLLARREERVERRLLRHVAEPAPVLDRVVRDVPAVEDHGSARWLHEAGEHPPGRRLSRAIRAEIADHLSRPHDEAHVVHDRDAVEALDRRRRELGLRNGEALGA